MDDFNTYEYVVPQKLKGAKVLRKVWLMLLYVAFVLLWIAFGFWSKLFPLLALCPVTLWILVFFTWRYVQVEYEYSVVSGSVTFSAVYGNRSRRTLCEFRIKDCATIAPMTDTYTHLIDKFSPEKTVDCRSFDGAQDAYFMLADTEGKRIAVYLEATEKMIKLCRFYNAPATTST